MLSIALISHFVKSFLRFYKKFSSLNLGEVFYFAADQPPVSLAAARSYSEITAFIKWLSETLLNISKSARMIFVRVTLP